MVRPFVDFGPAAKDYACHRPGFPDELFDRARGYGIGLVGQRVLDVGTGTGSLGRGFGQRGCAVVGVDPSPEMLTQAAALAAAERVPMGLVRAWAEATGVRGDLFDVVCAGQCWHWFDRDRAAHEFARVLRRSGHALVAYFTYLSDPESVGALTETLILKHNPSWPLAGSDGRQPWIATDLTAAGLAHVDTFELDLNVQMSHAAWRGRIRACNGVLTMPPDHAPTFDVELADLLARECPDPLEVPHRLFAIIAER